MGEVNAMTIIIKEYSSREEYLTDGIIMNDRGFRSLHYDSPHKITWVSGTDDPANTPPSPKRDLTESVYIRELATRDNVNIV